MSTFSLKIECGNDTLALGNGGDVSAIALSGILENVAQQVLDAGWAGGDQLVPGEESRVYDENGNRIGEWLYA